MVRTFSIPSNLEIWVSFFLFVCHPGVFLQSFVVFSMLIVFASYPKWDCFKRKTLIDSFYYKDM